MSTVVSTKKSYIDPKDPTQPTAVPSSATQPTRGWPDSLMNWRSRKPGIMSFVSIANKADIGTELYALIYRCIGP